MSEVDASEHLRLISRVIGQMGLYGDTAEEAFSEGLVHITIAAKSYDPTKGIPVPNWLARNIKWGILNWLRTQRQAYPIKDTVYEDKRPELQIKVEFNELLDKINSLLSERDKNILLATAAGYSGIDIAKRLGINSVAVHRSLAKSRKIIQAE